MVAHVQSYRHQAGPQMLWVALVAFLTVLFQAHLVHALDIEVPGGPVRRDILALYDSAHEATPQTSRVHQFLEMPLNWLGLSVTYQDVNKPLPPPDGMSRYSGIVTWFVEPLASPQRYLDWLDVATAKGLRLAVFSDVAPGATSASQALSDRIHARLGLKATDEHVSVTHKVVLDVTDPEMVGFERPLDKALPDFRVLHALEGKTRVHLSARIPVVGAAPAVLVSTGPGGGYVSDEYAIVFDANTDRVRWTLNPFAFLKRALAPDIMPIPDVTTLSGRRIYFSQIDGDGWNNVSQIDGYRQGQTLSADVVRKEAIEAYPDLPVTVGAIVGDLVPELGGTLGGREAAKKLYALPQVEVGSHTHSHPFDWSFYADYSRAREEALIDKVHIPSLPAFERARRLAYAAIGRKEPDDVISRYVAGSSDLPRTYLKEPFDLEREVKGALAFVQSLAPAGKKAMLYQWSGNCLPFEAAIAATRGAGVRNMNGGDTRLDSEFPSVFYVSPISKPVGTQRQIYSGNSNENTYTNDWTGPYYGFQLLNETVRNTETPRRLKPFNLYYHMYSGEREAALAALRQNLNLARNSLLVPISASHYAAIADDFFAVEIAQRDALSWAVRNRGAVQTVRFDDAGDLQLDIAKSKGVLGVTRHVGGAMYVSLDAAVDEVVVSLIRKAPQLDPVDEPETFARAGAQLISGHWTFRDYAVSGCGFSVAAQGFGIGDMVWQTAPNRKFDISAERDGTQIARVSVTADQSGVLQIAMKADAIKPLYLKFVCNE